MKAFERVDGRSGLYACGAFSDRQDLPVAKAKA